MPELDKKSLSEWDICTKLIPPALVAAGWDLQTHLREGVSFTQGRVACTVVPILPLAGQRPILAKVEQLTALVDALEQPLAASRATAEKLLTALVAELTRAPTPAAAEPAPLLAAEDPAP